MLVEDFIEIFVLDGEDVLVFLFDFPEEVCDVDDCELGRSFPVGVVIGEVVVVVLFGEEGWAVSFDFVVVGVVWVVRVVWEK